ncbi:bifunctional diguanylate cyclase/phosphodiesterase [Methylocapsa sp. S129]|uniref:putative bifunctional diguanylate cyclase/phosphodiesterase n=1 Tax=Methylocapsa sp. S129 TaxID=1641869 RepID=UPI00131CDDBA|nr:EAL domain-containing protein [Methylocapsa sp. S129]
MPDALYIAFVDSLLVEVKGLILSIVAVTSAGIATAIAAHSVSLWICTALMLLVSLIRLHVMTLHARSRPSPNVAVARSRETKFVVGAVTYMALMAIWTLVAFWVTDDGFTRFLTAATTIVYAFGMWTRSFAIDKGINAQIIAAFVPLSAAMVVGGGWYPLAILVGFIPTFLFIKASSSRMKANFLAEVAARHQVAMLAGRLDTALNNMSHGLCMVDSEGKLSLTNNQVLRIFGLSEKEAHVGADLRSILRSLVRKGVLARSEFKRLSQALFRNTNRDFVVPLETRDQRALEVTVQRIKSEGTVVVIQDITERRNAEAAIYRMVWFDPVTGLPNRRRFEQELSKALLARQSAGNNGAILFLDLDDFKQVNDSLGHARGDKLLIAVGDRLRSAVEDKDVVARWGGDEFAILLPSREDAHDPSCKAERIIAEINRPFQIDGYEIIIGVSVGVAKLRRDGLTLETLLSNADLALYAAKEEGRNRWRSYEAQLGLNAQSRRTLEIDLRAAIANETIEVHYQPINNAATREIVGCEALARWDHPTRGRISPGEFIPIAEELGLMDALGGIILHRACEACASWPERIFVAVNLSPLQVRGGRVANAVKDALQSSGLAPHRLEVEITESTILHDLPLTRQTLRSIREMGVRIALDDFGTGFSSLSYLHTFPLDKIKIDRSFTIAMGSDQRASIVIASVAGMCKMLGMDVLVEGIETERQMQFVDGLGSVAEVQGFLFSPAVPEKDIRAMFESAVQRKIA